jgi:uncharacterized SAM-binding protein YcdF (DUF218 family)
MNGNADILSAKRQGWRWVAAAAAVMVALSVWALLQAGRFLEMPASTPARADLIAVLGGDGGDRGLTAARLYAAGMAPRVLLTGMEASPREVRRAYLHWRAQVLSEAGVPLERFEYDPESSNSWEEAVNTRRLMESRGWRRVLVVSDPYHMRRLSWTWRRVFEGSGMEYSLMASTPAFWKPDEWWRDERSGAAVIMEYIKLGYYLVKY